jgi:hypothetical protein
MHGEFVSERLNLFMQDVSTAVSMGDLRMFMRLVVVLVFGLVFVLVLLASSNSPHQKKDFEHLLIII